ncbi:MAG: glycoside hydrolase N-terminal domain-containing protein [Candidatus Spyradenecus sp.]
MFRCWRLVLLALGLWMMASGVAWAGRPLIGAPPPVPSERFPKSAWDRAQQAYQFEHPAKRAAAGLPIGNGRLMALWRGAPAEETFSLSVQGGRQPLAALTVRQALPVSGLEHYRRGIRLDEGIAYAVFLAGGEWQIREAFVPRKEDVVAIYYHASQEVPMGLTCSLTPPGGQGRCAVLAPNRLHVQGSVGPDGEAFDMVAAVFTDGTVEAEGETLRVRGAVNVTLYLAAYADSARAESRLARCLEGIAAAEKRGVWAVSRNHALDFRERYSRAYITLGAKSELRPTPEGWIEARERGQFSPEFLLLTYDFSRYLFLSGNCPGAYWPARAWGLAERDTAQAVPDGAAGWPLAYHYAQMGLGDEAMGALDDTPQHLTMNLCVNAEAPAQVADLGGVATALNEMLLRSDSGVVEILPALPRRLAASGSFRLMTADGLWVTCQWRDGRPLFLELTSPQGGTYTVHTPVGYERFTLSADQTQSMFFHWCP